MQVQHLAELAAGALHVSHRGEVSSQRTHVKVALFLRYLGIVHLFLTCRSNNCTQYTMCSEVVIPATHNLIMGASRLSRVRQCNPLHI